MAKRKPLSHEIVTTEPSQTKQDHGGMASVTEVASMYFDGRLPYPTDPPLVFGVQDARQMQEHLNNCADLETKFNELPSDLRAEHQTPIGYLEWMDEHSAEIDEFGLEQITRQHAYELANPPEPEKEPDVKPDPRASAPENEGTGDEPAAE